MAKKVNKKERPMDILLAEDNIADVKIALRAFAKSKLKNKIYVVSNGRETLDFIYHTGKYQDKEKFPTPDLILLDIKMPKLDGFQVLERIKSDLQYSYIPVIMLTSSRNEEDIAKSYKNGAASFIAKPVDYEEFVKIVDGFNYYWHIINRLSAPDADKE
jgi:two-component system response regulator